MRLTGRRREAADQRWAHFRDQMTAAGATPILVVAELPGPTPGLTAYRFGISEDRRADLPRLLREAADAIQRQPAAGGGVILTPPTGQAEGGGA